jgi:fibronectin type 3 domain-containing protein
VRFATVGKMNATPGKIKTLTGRGAVCLVLFVISGLAAACSDDAPPAPPASDTPATSATPGWTANMPAGDRMYFFDNFQNGLPAWEPMDGEWDVTQNGPGAEYSAIGRKYALAYAGNPNWRDYDLSAKVVIDDDRQGQVGIVGRGDGDHYYYELVLGRNPKGEKTWAIRQRSSHRWNTLAAGAYDYAVGTPYVMRLSFRGLKITGSLSRDGGRSFDKLAETEASADGWQVGRIGVVTYGGAARFDDIGVSGAPTIFLVDNAHGWGPVSLLRDNTNTFSNGKPSGGWYVTPIHVNLRPDGKVLVSGFSRKGASNCSGTTQRQNGMTWLLDPSVLDSAADNSTLFTTPINEQSLDPVHDVMYCAGHSTMADGRVFFTAGTRYPSTLPDSSPERGIRYSRIFDGTNMVRIKNVAGTTHFMMGGQSAAYDDPGGVGDGGTVRGEKWYPTTLLMPDSKMLIFGGFHWSTNGPSSKPNNSFETFDPAAWDANHNTYPYAVLTQHSGSGLSADLPPTRGYSNMFLLPKPVPAGSAGSFARSVAIYGGVGRVILFNHEPGPVDTARIFARPNALTISPDSSDIPNERAEGGSGVLLTDGRLMVFNGGHTGDGAKRAFVYDPYADSWVNPALDTGISRVYGQAVQLPDGTVMAINGYNGNPGGNGQSDPEDGNPDDIANPIGDVRRSVLVDPYATPMTAVGQTAWPEATHRGYHSVSLLLKDGRILTGGGKDGTHATGCEKNELRIYTPPYLQGNPTRPQITNIADGQNVQIGSAPITINYTGTLKSARGVALVALGSLTHAFDMGQRYVPLTVVSGGGATGSVTVRPPTNINIAQPGYYTLFVINSTGTPSLGVSVKLTPPPACTYNVNGGDQYIEAEGRSRGDGPFTQVTDAARSGGAYLQVNEGSGSHTTVPDEGKVLWYDVNVGATGNFFIWALANGPDAASDTMWISVDGNADQQLTLPTPVNTWGWVKLNTTAINIPAGLHTIKVKVREDGALIDKLAISTNAGFTPTGLGGTALTCGGPALPPPPTGLGAIPGDGQVLLSWNSVAGATGYTLKMSTTLGGPYSNVAGAINIPATSFTVTGLTNGTTYDFVVSATNAGGEGANSAEVAATPAAGSWTDSDVGTVGVAGSSTIAGGTFTVKGGGADITGTVDAFHFLHQPATGNVRISAHIASISGGDGVNVKAGVMIRDGVAANAANGFTMIKPTSTQNKFQRRLTAGGTTVSTVAASATPTWIRLTRTGTTFLSEQSSDGNTWTTIASDTISMTAPRVGLAVTSHSLTALTTVVFDNVVITKVPAAPANLIASAGDAQVLLGWDASPGAASYTVLRSTTSGSGYAVVAGGATVMSTSFTDVTVTNGTTYFYVVTATNAMGTSGNSNQASAQPMSAGPPAAPTNLMAAPGNRKVDLSWTGSAGATSYTLKRSTTMGTGYTAIQTNIAATTATDSTAANGTQYFYLVSASNGSGESPDSNEATATPTVPAPGSFGATGGDAVVNLVWSPVTNASSYTVKRSLTTGGPYTNATFPGITMASFADTTVSNGTTYFYVVAALDGSATGPNSVEKSATPAASMAPAAPSNLAATITGGNTANLTWTDNSSNETGFRVERKVGVGAYATLSSKAVNVTSHSDTPLTANTYTYRVIATGSPDSAASNEVVVVIRGAEADAHVRNGNATSNYGANTTWDVKNAIAAGSTREAFIRFSLTDVAATVTSAKIRLFGNSVTSAKNIAVSAVSDITWVEGTGTVAVPTTTGITWNTKPAIGAQQTSQSISTTAGFWEFDVTAYVQAQKTAGATKVTLTFTSLTASDEGPTVFNTKENASNPPQAVISSR